MVNKDEYIYIYIRDEADGWVYEWTASSIGVPKTMLNFGPLFDCDHRPQGCWSLDIKQDA